MPFVKLPCNGEKEWWLKLWGDIRKNEELLKVFQHKLEHELLHREHLRFYDNEKSYLSDYYLVTESSKTRMEKAVFGLAFDGKRMQLCRVLYRIGGRSSSFNRSNDVVIVSCGPLDVRKYQPNYSWQDIRTGNEVIRNRRQMKKGMGEGSSKLELLRRLVESQPAIADRLGGIIDRLEGEQHFSTTAWLFESKIERANDSINPFSKIGQQTCLDFSSREWNNYVDEIYLDDLLENAAAALKKTKVEVKEKLGEICLSFGGKKLLPGWGELDQLMQAFGMLPSESIIGDILRMEISSNE